MSQVKYCLVLLSSTSVHMSFQASRLGGVFHTTAALTPVKSLHGVPWRMTITYPSECSVFLLHGALLRAGWGYTAGASPSEMLLGRAEEGSIKDSAESCF